MKAQCTSILIELRELSAVGLKDGACLLYCVWLRLLPHVDARLPERYPALLPGSVRSDVDREVRL